MNHEPTKVPVVHSRDDEDPLSPHHIARLDLSTEQAVVAFRELTRVARDPESEPSYRAVVDAMVRHRDEFAGLMVLAEKSLANARELRSLAANLDLAERENYESYREALGRMEEADARLTGLFARHKRINDLLGGRR